MTLCERCDKEIRPSAELPMLGLKALGLYETSYQTLGAIKHTITVNAGGVDTELGSVDITAQQYLPRMLHRIPARPMNAYPIINGVSMRLFATAAAPTLVSLVLKFRDHALIDHMLMSYRGTLQDDVKDAAFNPVIVGTTMGEVPNRFGTYVLEGTITLGGAASIRFDIFANLGVLYGAPV